VPGRVVGDIRDSLDGRQKFEASIDQSLLRDGILLREFRYDRVQERIGDTFTDYSAIVFREYLGAADRFVEYFPEESLFYPARGGGYDYLDAVQSKHVGGLDDVGFRGRYAGRFACGHEEEMGQSG
jgi:hypothetical protein